MKKIADWLIRVEMISGKFYRDAAAYFDDPDLVAFLEHASRDEAFHAEIMTRASKLLQNHPEIKSGIEVDQKIRDAIEGPLRESQKKLNAKTLTPAQLIDCIVNVEFSEWNDIFLYVLNSLKKIEPQFKAAAAKIQHHLKHIEHYVASSAYGRQKIEKLHDLEPVWKERILIIEDDPYLSELFIMVLRLEGSVDLAEDGEAGLEKIRQRYYRLIVSDVNMPGMDGISLYHRAAAEFPDIGDRYLFITGNSDRDLIAFFKANNLRYLTKPASIHDIKCNVLELLHNIPSS